MNDTPENYREQIYEKYLTTTFEARNDATVQGVQKAAKDFVSQMGCFLPEKKDAPILEVGCGLGGFLTASSNLGYSDVTGLDISPEQVAFCRELGFTEVFCTDAVAYLNENELRYGLIVMSDVLEHIPKNQVLHLLSLVFDHLEAGGRVIIRVPNMSNPFNIRTRYVDFTHEVGFSKESLAQVLRVTGFKVETVHGAFVPDSRWPMKLIFDRILWFLFIQFYRRTLHLSSEVVPGKNLIGVGVKPEQI